MTRDHSTIIAAAMLALGALLVWPVLVFSAPRPRMAALLDAPGPCSPDDSGNCACAGYVDGMGQTHNLQMGCEFMTGGDCLMDEQCEFTNCGLKILINGQGAECPEDEAGNIDLMELRSKRHMYPECALWHLPGTTGTPGACPTWSSEGAAAFSLPTETRSGEG